MKLLSISSDRHILKENSFVRKRTVKQGEFFEEIHIILFTKGFFAKKKIEIAKNVWVYTTGSWSRFLYMWDAIRIGKKILGNLTLDIGNSGNNYVITSQDPFEAGRVGLTLKKKFNIPLQIQVHTDFLSPHFGHTFLNRVRIKMAQGALRECNTIRVVSERIKRSIIREYHLEEQKITVLPVFIDVDLIKASPILLDVHKKYPQFNFVVLMVSRLTSEKNISLGLKAFFKVLRAFPKAGLVIVGEGAERHSLEREVRSLGIEKSVVFEGWQNDLISYYKTSNLFLSTSRFEGFGVTLIEAAAAGCPIVTSDVGIAEDVFHNGVHATICPIYSEDCFVESILSIIGNNQKRETMRRMAQDEVAERFSGGIDAYTKKYVELLNMTK